MSSTIKHLRPGFVSQYASSGQLSRHVISSMIPYSPARTASLLGDMRKIPPSNGHHACDRATVFRMQHVFPLETPPMNAARLGFGSARP